MTENEKLDLVFDFYKHHTDANTTPTTDELLQIAQKTGNRDQFDDKYTGLLHHLLHVDNLLVIKSGIPRTTIKGNNFEGYVKMGNRLKKEAEFDIMVKTKPIQLANKSLDISLLAVFFSGIAILISVSSTNLKPLTQAVVYGSISILMLVIIVPILIKRNRSKIE